MRVLPALAVLFALSPCVAQTPVGAFCATSEANLMGPATTGATLPPGATVRIPVFFHVFLADDGVTGDVPTARLREQIAILNSSFARSPSRGGTAIPTYVFEMIGVSRIKNSAYFYSADPRGSIGITQESQVDPGRVMSFYVYDFPDRSLGYFSNNTQLPHTEYISVGNDYMPGGNGIALGDTTTYYGYNTGEIAVHEFGHFF